MKTYFTRQGLLAAAFVAATTLGATSAQAVEEVHFQCFPRIASGDLHSTSVSYRKR